MKYEKVIRAILIWLPSVIISMVFIENGIGKISLSNQGDKIIANNTVTVIIGIILLIATTLFLFNKTIILGTTLLALYMTFIVFIHMVRGKPFEVTALIVIATIYAAYIRRPQLLHSKHNP